MLALAAARLGFDVAVLANEAASPAGRVSAVEIVGDYGDLAALERLADVCDVITFEFENVPGAAIAALESAGVAVAPPGRALTVSQDRVAEKTFLNALGLATTPFAAVDGPADVAAALAVLSAPALLKTRRDGYDGKGQTWVETAEDAAAAFQRIGARPGILEAAAKFERELSVIAARGRDGSFAMFPLSENQHEAGVLRRTLAPAEGDPDLTERARSIARTLADALDYVGVMGVELFAFPDGRLWVNEFAPRVHNSGHWTLDGCPVDQFEQHVRAIAGWPLGPTTPFGQVEMLNLLGEETEAWATLSGDPGARPWFYGKRQAAPRRKMGHVNRFITPKI
jgi:5-(carboxyamino)imidazole ribonucleotide synthase